MLSVLDQSPVPEGSLPADALRNTVELARAADAAGYHRYWLAEHHCTPSFAGPAPEVLAAAVAERTSRIRVGSGGVLLTHYSPFRVAEQFRVLNALHSGRIDLGVGRSAGAAPLESIALAGGRQPDSDDFVRKLVELRDFLDGTFDGEHPYSRIRLMPADPNVPQMWALGSSMTSSVLAGRLGLPYSFAHFGDPTTTRAAIERYRAEFVGHRGSEPRVMVGLGVYCASTEAEARRLLSSQLQFKQRMRRGDLRPVPLPEEPGRPAAAVDPDWDTVVEFPRYVVGDPRQVRESLDDIRRALDIDEFIVLTTMHDHCARVRSYELLADAYSDRPEAA